MSTMEKTIREAARQYLENGDVSFVVGYERGPRGVVRPAFIYEPEGAERLVWGPDCSLNLVTFLHNHKHSPRRGVPPPKVAVVVRPCDARAIQLLDGGLDVVDLSSMEAVGFAVTEETLGGDITDVVVVGDDLGYATVSATGGTDRLVRFDPAAGTAEDDPVLEGDGFTLLQMQLTDDGRLLVVDRDLHEPGLAVLDAASGALLAHVPVGMAPFSVCVP